MSIRLEAQYTYQLVFGHNKLIIKSSQTKVKYMCESLR